MYASFAIERASDAVRVPLPAFCGDSDVCLHPAVRITAEISAERACRFIRILRSLPRKVNSSEQNRIAVGHAAHRKRTGLRILRQNISWRLFLFQGHSPD